MSTNPYIGFRVPKEVKEALKAAAASEKRTPSQWARNALVEMLQRASFLEPDPPQNKRPRSRPDR